MSVFHRQYHLTNAHSSIANTALSSELTASLHTALKAKPTACHCLHKLAATELSTSKLSAEGQHFFNGNKTQQKF
jgi:hypothetical protein